MRLSQTASESKKEEVETLPEVENTVGEAQRGREVCHCGAELAEQYG